MRLRTAGVPAGPVLDVKQMHAHEQTRARQMVVETDHASLGKVTTLGCPVKFSSTPTGPIGAAPLLGQHTREVLREHGFNEPEIDALLKSGAAVAA